MGKKACCISKIRTSDTPNPSWLSISQPRLWSSSSMVPRWRVPPHMTPLGRPAGWVVKDPHHSCCSSMLSAVRGPLLFLQAQSVHGAQWMLRGFTCAKPSCPWRCAGSQLCLQLQNYMLYMHIHTMEWNIAIKMMWYNNEYLSWTGCSELHSIYLMHLYQCHIVYGSSWKLLGNSTRIFRKP